jgi:hypothetical protein
VLFVGIGWLIDVLGFGVGGVCEVVYPLRVQRGLLGCICLRFSKVRGGGWKVCLMLKVAFPVGTGLILRV